MFGAFRSTIWKPATTKPPLAAETIMSGKGGEIKSFPFGAVPQPGKANNQRRQSFLQLQQLNTI